MQEFQTGNRTKDIGKEGLEKCEKARYPKAKEAFQEAKSGLQTATNDYDVKARQKFKAPKRRLMTHLERKSVER